MKFLRFLLLLVAIPLGTISILTFSLFTILTTSSLYKDTLVESYIYSELENPTKYVKKENDELQLFVGPLVKQFDIPSLAQTSFEANVDYLTNWVQGKSELYLYFPVEEIKSRFKSDEFSSAVLQAFEDNYKALDVCTSEQLVELQSQGEDFRNEGNFLPECKPEDFDSEFELRRSELEEVLDDILKSDETFDEVLKQADLEFISEKTPYATFINESSDTPEDAQKTLDNFNQLEEILEIVRILPLIGILAFILLVSIVAISIKKADFKKMLKVVLNNLVLVGFLLSVMAISLIAIRQVGIAQIPFSDISNDAIYEPIEQKIEFIVRAVSLKIVTQFVIVSFGMFLITSLLRVFAILLKEKKLEQESV